MAAAKTEAARGLYVYGVTLAEIPCEGATVDVGRLRAVVSEKPLDRYEPEAIEAALSEQGWLEEQLRAHDATLEAVHAAGPVAPFRFGTIFRTEGELRAALERAEEPLAERLGELRGASEWGLKAWVDDETLRGWFEQHDEEARRGRAELDAVSDRGRRYLLEKRLRRRVDSEVSDLALDRVHSAHAEFAAMVREASADRPSGFDPRETRRPVLRAAYLVDDSRVEGFRGAVAELQRRDGEIGVEYVVSGPWPPYSFVVELA